LQPESCLEHIAKSAEVCVFVSLELNCLFELIKISR